MYNTKIPKEVKDKILVSGELGNIWLNNLDQLIDRYKNEWKIELGQILHGGTHGVVIKSKKGNEFDSVIKFSMPDIIGGTDISYEIYALQIANGCGYAKLYNYNLEDGVMLMEDIGQPLGNTSLPTREKIYIMCDALKKSWFITESIDALQSTSEIIDFFEDLLTNLYIEFNELITFEEY